MKLARTKNVRIDVIELNHCEIIQLYSTFEDFAIDITVRNNGTVEIESRSHEKPIPVLKRKTEHNHHSGTKWRTVELDAGMVKTKHINFK